MTRHRLLHDGWLQWRLSRSRLLRVYVALFSDIILLMSRDDNKLVLRCHSTALVTGHEDTRILFIPIIRIRELLIRDNAAGQLCWIPAVVATTVGELKYTVCPNEKSCHLFCHKKVATCFFTITFTNVHRPSWFLLCNFASEY